MFYPACFACSMQRSEENDKHHLKTCWFTPGMLAKLCSGQAEIKFIHVNNLLVYPINIHRSHAFLIYRVYVCQ